MYLYLAKVFDTIPGNNHVIKGLLTHARIHISHALTLTRHIGILVTYTCYFIFNDV